MSPISSSSEPFESATALVNSTYDQTNVARVSTATDTVSNAIKQADLDFSGLDLTCPINANDIANRWLNNFVPMPGQTIKNYTPSVSAFINRVLRSYANAAVRGHKIPPFIHWSQMASPSSSPLTACLSAIRVFEQPLPSNAEGIAEVLERDMTKLYELQETFDDMGLLAAFQAYLIYGMVVFFRIGGGCYPFLRQAMMYLQELACATAKRGLACPTERQADRPRWESWIVAEAKRRTLFTMCLFDSALLAHDGLPTHLATELRGLPAPSSKCLWETRDRLDWKTKYDLHLAASKEGALRIEELWPVPPEFGPDDVARRRDRVDTWLEDLDEFGTMVYAVTSCTHGS
ncbi:hypothetical protein CCHL11_04442 [Colletotrichum chlorophyti]|uniref:Transcription factor domain-containing protein n=1 Tax=Colletotrichum chlorophyti TaxID=708187 RepID=A0A1Q8S4A4_9PEZI|nr:hypothetical protein CCHL11_04442 [Colletotrichum chlorophyti]